MSLNNISIRSFKSEDLLHCQDITRAVYQEQGYTDGYAEKAIIEGDLADIQMNYVNISGGHWWVAVFDNEQIIGQIGIQPLSIGNEACYRDILQNSESALSIHPDQICELRRLAVLSKYRRQHIASRLVRTLIEYAKNIDYKAIHLTTLTEMKAACQLYEKFGFKRDKIEQYNINIDSNNKIKYTKSTVFDHHLKDLPMSESQRLYVQHYWLML